jgi:Domain of unknown function (DUF4158)
MPGSFRNDAERERLRRFPTEIPPEDLIGYFTLAERDLLLVRGQRRAHTGAGASRRMRGYPESRVLAAL